MHNIPLWATAALTIFLSACVSNAPKLSTENGNIEASYIGVKEYGTIKRKEVLADSSQVYLFEVDGDTIAYSIDNPNDKFPLHNELIKGISYELTLENNHITNLKRLEKANVKFTPVIKPTPGKRTLKNLIATALSPIGTVLYVFGGGWNFQTDGSSKQARSIGISDWWVKFYNENAEDYEFRDSLDRANTTFPFGGWSDYYYAGLDCSGYMGWVLYNTLYKTSLDKPGFVMNSTKMAKSLAADYEFGKWTHKNASKLEFRTGDIVSIAGHIYLVLGICKDGSVIIVHSSPQENEKGYEGGGVMMSPLNPQDLDNEDCDAFRLVDKYMKKFYPHWDYETVMRSKEDYITFPKNKPTTGIFHWNLGEKAVLKDPEKYASKSAEEILKDLYGI